jgi:hypothetical protein
MKNIYAAIVIMGLAGGVSAAEFGIPAMRAADIVTAQDIPLVRETAVQNGYTPEGGDLVYTIVARSARINGPHLVPYRIMQAVLDRKLIKVFVPPPGVDFENCDHDKFAAHTIRDTGRIYLCRWVVDNFDANRTA